MGDDIIITDIQVIQGGLFLIDFCNTATKEKYRALAEPSKFLSMIGNAMQANHDEWNQEYERRKCEEV